MSPDDTLGENQRLAHELALALSGEGPTHVVVSPGSRSTPLALAFDALEACELHVVLDERAAAFVALGMARATGRPAVVLATSGSAGANHYPAVVEANLARVPMLVVTADRPGELQGCGAPQTMPQRALFGEHVRLALSLPEPSPSLSQRWLHVVGTRARAAATGSPAGPVHLNVPFREPLYDPERSFQPEGDVALPTVVRGRRRLDTDTLEALAADLSSCSSGAIVCGPLAPSTVDARELASAVCGLGARLGWPVLADATSGLRFGGEPAQHPIACGDTLLRAGVGRAPRVARILRFGQPPTTKSVLRWLAAHAGDMWLVDPDGEWLDGGGAASRLLVAEPVSLARDLTAALPSRPNTEAAATLARFRAAEAAASRALSRHARDGEWEGRVVSEVVMALPPGARLHVASSMPVRDLDSFSGVREAPLEVTSNRGVNGIDGTVATALGLALVSRVPTAALLGDLAFLHDLDGLEAAGALAATRGLALVLVVVDNGGGGIFGELPIARHPTAFERLFLTARPGDAATIARGLGLASERVAPSGLGAAMTRAFAAGGVTVLHVLVDREASSTRRRRALDEAGEAASKELSG
ncbi:MAG: 2-succinyl-5-enolpyruvyl-6-hydroxy-3-cyclohexene-1-carboxylic-acid synthase [Deltaproteobacteria bacterium]|nr:2-succinyl-5-enolpyruvyl-6-hydroxy-3-cyclohexene-1-carboxylic-acid synthase [Deltaproteobacteria bacterium]